MYVKDGIAYAGTDIQPLKVSGIRPLEDYKLWIRFSNDEAKIVNLSPLLESPAFQPLKDVEVFKSVYIDYGMAAWNNGDIDIATEYLYEHGVSSEDEYIA